MKMLLAKRVCKKVPSYYVSALDKGLRLLEILAESPEPLGLSEIARNLETNKHMTLRLLRTFLEKGWIAEVERGPKYQLTLLPFHYFSKPVSQNMLIEQATVPVQQLCNDASESASLGVLSDNRVLYLLHFEGCRRIVNSGRLGGRYYLHAAASGKVLLAHAPETLVDRLLAEGLEPLALKTITTRERLDQELCNIRQQGYALDEEEYSQGLMCYASPIYDYRGLVVAAVNVSVLCMSYTKERLIEDIGSKVLATTREISSRMGYCP